MAGEIKKDPLQKVTKAGFRLQTFKALLVYLEDCRRYGGFPDAREIIQRLHLPGRPVILFAVLPAAF